MFALQKARVESNMSLRASGARLSTASYENGLQDEAKEASSQSEKETFVLKKKVGLVGSISIIAGIMVGSGIFASPVGVLEGANNSVGMSLVLWAACGLISCLAALCYSELGTVIRESGSNYIYLHQIYTPVLAFMYAWTAVIVTNSAGNAATAVTFGSYLLAPFYVGDCRPPDITVKCIAAAGVIILHSISYVNVKAATKVQGILTIAKFIGMAIIIVGGMVRLGQRDKVGIDNLQHAFRPEDLAGLGFTQIGLAFYQGLWSYEGWNNLNFITEEVKNSNKTLPLAIMIAVPLVTVFYVLVNISYFSVLTPQDMLESDAVAVTWGYKVLGNGGWVMSLVVCCSTLGSMNGTYLAAGRLPFVAGRRGHLPKILSMVTTAFYTPGPALMLNCVLTLAFLIPNDFSSLINAFSFTAWLFYTLVIGGVVVLRFTHPELPRPYKVPIFIPCLVSIVAVYLVVAPLVDNPDIIILYAAAFVLCSPIVYFIFVYKEITIPGVDYLTKLFQQTLDVAPTDWKSIK